MNKKSKEGDQIDRSDELRQNSKAEKTKEELNDAEKIDNQRLSNETSEKLFFINSVFKSENLYLFLIPIISYLLTYAYSFGRTFYFRLPLWLITIELRNIIVASLVLFISVMLIVYIFTTGIFEKILNRIVKVFLLKYPEYKKDLDKKATITHYSIDLVADNIVRRIREGTFKYLILALVIFLGSIACVVFGYVSPQFDRKYFCLSNEVNMVIIDKYQDFLVQKRYDPQTGRMEEDFKIFKVREDTSIDLKPCYINPTLNYEYTGYIYY